MKVSVLGAGRWGSFIAWYLSSFNEVTLWTRPESERSRELIESRGNGLLTFRDDMRITTSLDEALDTDTVIISISSQNLRELAKSLSHDRQRRFVLCMKGLEHNTGKRLSEVFLEGYGESVPLAVWLGPGHVQDFVSGIPNCMVIDSESDTLKRELCNAFSSRLIRFYYGTDLIGNEIGGASKNVVGIAAGMLDGLGLSTLKGALMARGTREISRLIGRLGGDPTSAYGLCHLGDYEATLFSSHSHNRAFGEAFVKGETFDKLAEGVMTCKALKRISEELCEELPICSAVYDVLFDRADPQDTLNALFTRAIKNEF